MNKYHALMLRSVAEIEAHGVLFKAWVDMINRHMEKRKVMKIEIIEEEDKFGKKLFYVYSNVGPDYDTRERAAGAFLSHVLKMLEHENMVTAIEAQVLNAKIEKLRK